jgi:hypothetical protein
MNIFTDCLDRDFAEDGCVPAHWKCDHGFGRFEPCFHCIFEDNLSRIPKPLKPLCLDPTCIDPACRFEHIEPIAAAPYWHLPGCNEEQGCDFGCPLSEAPDYQERKLR